VSEPKKPTTLVAPDGQRFDVPTPDGVADLKAKGWRELNDGERKDLTLQQKYGEGVLPPVAAAVSGAASALTFGATDAIASGIGGDVAEANRELAERNPTAHTVGEVAGIAMPIAGQIAALGTAGKVAKAAGGAITQVSKGAQALGEGAASVARGVGLGKVAPIVGAGVQGAAEGVAFQMGHNVGEAARRDAKLDAETLLAHVGEAAYLSGGIAAAIPAAGMAARWSADKAIAGLEQGMQGLRSLGFRAAGLGVDAAEAGAAAVVSRADDIGAAAEKVSTKAGAFSDDVLLPKIREGLTAQTGRPDVIDDVFRAGEEGRALRQKLGSETLTGTREAQSEELGRALNTIWKQTLDNSPLFDDIAIAVKKDLQVAELGASQMSREAQLALSKKIAQEAGATFDRISKYNPTAAKFFKESIDDFIDRAMVTPSPEAIYMGLDRLKGATDKIGKWAQGAQLGDTGAAFAAEEARRFRTFAKDLLEDSGTWGAAGVVQREANAKLTTYYRAKEQFEKQFAAAKAKGQPVRVLDGGKIKKFARDITGQPGEVRNAVIDDLVDAQTELIAFTEKLSKRAQQQAREALGNAPAVVGSAPPRAGTFTPETVADVLSRSTASIDDLARTKATAKSTIDRAEVLQETQSAILSRQGAGVNPLPVDLAQKIGAGALVGGVIGGVPGALVGGSVTSVLQKYGAITTNPKSAIEFLNTIDRLRGADKKRVAEWLRTTLGETADTGVRGKLGETRASIDRGNKETAKRLLAARREAEVNLASMATKLERATPGAMRRLLPAVSYGTVTESDPREWWARTSSTIAAAQADPQKVVERIDRDLAGIADVLPQQTQAIADQALRVLGYLADRMPRNPRPYALGTEWHPSKADLKAYRDLVLVATKPDALLSLLSTGTASREQVDAVRTLWPAKFEDMRGQIVNAVMTAAADGRPVPYKSRIRLGHLLGVPLDASQEPGYAQWIEQASGGAQEEQQPSGGALKLDTDRDLPMSARAAERR
jgi:hypothetical protein